MLNMIHFLREINLTSKIAKRLINVCHTSGCTLEFCNEDAVALHIILIELKESNTKVLQFQLKVYIKQKKKQE